MSEKKRVVVSDPSVGSFQKSGTTNPGPGDNLVFGKRNYMLMGLGILLIALGFILMAGGNMPSPEVWDESLIYSPRRTVLAPMLILAGLIVEIVAIFRK
jgi:hypothetical protein